MFWKEAETVAGKKKKSSLQLGCWEKRPMRRDETWEKVNHAASTRLCEGAHVLDSQEKVSGWEISKSTKISPYTS